MVVLHTAAPLTANTSYTVTANGVVDLTGNALSPNTVTFTSGKLFTGYPAGPKLTGLSRFQKFLGLTDEASIATAIAAGTPPDLDTLLPLFEIPINADAKLFVSHERMVCATNNWKLCVLPS